MIIVGLLMIPIPFFIMFRINALNTKKITKILIDILLGLVSFLYIVFSIIVIKTEPFNFEITSIEDVTIAVAVIFISSPYLWITLYYYCGKLFRSIRVRKNAKIKSNSEYCYFRDDLNRISPSIVMFTSIMTIDVRKCISATILKLKLTGYLQEIDNELQCTIKEDNELLNSEKLVLYYFKYNSFDQRLYKQLVEKEALKYNYIKKNSGGKILKITKMLVTLFIPVILIVSSIQFEDFFRNNYRIYSYDDIRYVEINSITASELLYLNKINIDDYYHIEEEIDGQKEISYSYRLIRADRFQYSIVRKIIILENLVSILFLVSIIMVFVAAFMLIEQIKYFRKNYIRTAKGIELLNKSYALKNFLMEFSIIKNRTEEELILWEYYLIYAIILDVNIKIKDRIIEKYLKLTVFE
jgi:hypothetical protein